MFKWLLDIIDKLLQFINAKFHGSKGDIIENAQRIVGSPVAMTDVLTWISDRMEPLSNLGCKTVCVIIGDKLADFIEENQKQGKYAEGIGMYKDDILRLGVWIVAVDDGENILDEQLMYSCDGLSEDLVTQFKGLPTLKIYITQ